MVNVSKLMGDLVKEVGNNFKERKIQEKECKFKSMRKKEQKLIEKNKKAKLWG